MLGALAYLRETGLCDIPPSLALATKKKLSLPPLLIQVCEFMIKKFLFKIYLKTPEFLAEFVVTNIKTKKMLFTG